MSSLFFSLFTSFERAKSVHLHKDKDLDENFQTIPESAIHTILDKYRISFFYVCRINGMNP